MSDSHNVCVMAPNGVAGEIMQFSHLQIFLKVIETGSFSGAGAALSVAQPAVSRVVRQMESESGSKLFHRHGRGVQPTQAGERLAYHAHHILRHERELRSELSDLSGTLQGMASMAIPPGAGKVIMVPLVTRFKALHPAAELRVMEVFTGDMPEKLANGTLDIALTYASMSSVSALREPLVREPIYLIGDATSPATQGDEIKMADIAKLPLILPTRRSGLRGDIDAALARAGIKANIVLELDATGPLLSLVRAKIGYTVLPLCSLHGESHELFSTARLTDPYVERELSLASTRKYPLTAVAREAARLVRQETLRYCHVAGWQPI